MARSEPTAPLLIGALARQAGASPKAIRLYESLGLLTGVQRRGAYRVYSPLHVQQVQLIREAQRLGFRLAELKAALPPQATAGLDWARLAEALAHKRHEIAAEVSRLQLLERQLGRVVDEIHQCLAEQAARGAAADCPLPGLAPVPPAR